ncbi:MAG: MBL fold metallo-hydrolase [Pedosphaera sp.]|nr:MBL fold metallo-hydrolase [Pedosphaera sp.]
MSSKKPNPYLVVLDVGHGSAAVLHDEGGTVVFDTGSNGANIKRHVAKAGVTKIEAMLLSHADKDHVGGAVTLLMDGSVAIAEVLMNSDASKDTFVFQQLRYVLAEANKHHGTKIDRRLATSTTFIRNGLGIEVLHPPDAVILAGVGSKSKTGGKLTSNSMSAAIRVSRGPKSSILLGGDIEYDCVDEWKKTKLQPSAKVLIFPHHGGLPGSPDESEAKLFGYEITKLVSPDVVVFSNHRTKHGNPRECILKAIAKAVKGIRFACTQLPQHLHPQVKATGCWSLHKSKKGAGVIEGAICLVFKTSDIEISFGEKP